MDLVVMAAGMGSRFGGLKQIEPIDDDKNFIIDYSVHDAIKAGFDRVVLIIKEENYEYFSATVGKRLSSKVPVKYVFQSLEDVPAGTVIPESRKKMWGTAHALHCCKGVVADRFAVINADDFYGYESFKLIADFLKSNKDEDFVSAGFCVENTLTDKGTVKRGVFTLKDSVAIDLIESEVERKEDKIMATPLGQNKWKEIPKGTLVSMTMFGFTQKFMERIDEDYNNFFAQPQEILEKEEFLLPTEVDNMMKSGEVQLHVYTTPAKWYGITYREDLENFKNAIKTMKQNGIYPEHLY